METFKRRSEARAAHPAGNAPDSALDETSTTRNVVALPQSAGRGPVKLLRARIRFSSLGSDPNPPGSGPWRPLPIRDTISTSLSAFSWGGTKPVSLLDERSTDFSDASGRHTPASSGRAPSSASPGSEIAVTLPPSSHVMPYQVQGSSPGRQAVRVPFLSIAAFSSSSARAWAALALAGGGGGGGEGAAVAAARAARRTRARWEG